MPPVIPNKFYKTTVNGIAAYDILPGTNTPQGYQEVSRDEFVTGQQSELNRLRSISGIDTTREQSTIQGLISRAQAISGNTVTADPSGYITRPDTGTTGLASQYQADMANQQAINSGQMTQIGTAPNGQPLYAPAGSAAATPGTQATQQNPNPVAGGGTGYVGSPKINIPQTIPDSVLNYSGSKAGVLAQAQSKAPQTNLQPGQSGPEVKALQDFLIGQGYDIPAGATSFFGDQTKAALTKFQQDQKVQAGQNFGFYGPKTIEAANKLSQGITQATTGATDSTSAIQQGNAVLSQNGLPELKISGTINAADVPSVFSYFIQSMQSKQQRLDEAQKELDASISAGNRGAVYIQGKKTDMPLIGRELQNLKETVEFTTRPLQDQVDSLSRSIGMDKDMMNTIMAYGQYVQKLNAPDFHSIGGSLYKISPDGSVSLVGTDVTKNATGSGTLGEEGSKYQTFLQLAPGTPGAFKIAQQKWNTLNDAGKDTYLEQLAVDRLPATVKTQFVNTIKFGKDIARSLNELENYKGTSGVYKSLANKAAPFANIEQDQAYNKLKSSIEAFQGQKINEVYGAALTGQELARANQYFVDFSTDSLETIRTKLSNLVILAESDKEAYLSIGSGDYTGGQSTGVAPGVNSQEFADEDNAVVNILGGGPDTQTTPKEDGFWSKLFNAFK